MRSPVLSRALLGLIAAEPMSGYGLARLFERTLARAWPARHPQIYPALAELEEQGLLRVSETGPRGARVRGHRGRGRRSTAVDARERTDRTVRNETILRLFMLWLLESREAITFFNDEIESHRQRLVGFEQTLADDERQRRKHGTAQGGIAFCASLALEWAIRYERDYIAWATQARDRIAARAKAWDNARERQLGQHKATA